MCQSLYVSHAVRYVGQVSLVSVSVCLSVHPHIHSTLIFCVVLEFILFVSDIHSLIHSFFVMCLGCGMVNFFVLGKQHSYYLFLEESAGPEKGLFDVSSPDKDLRRLIC